MNQIYFYILYFAFYSFLGWICETAYCSIPSKRLIYRGFLHGPVCPIYGFGGLLVTEFLKPFAENLVLLFILGALCTSILEYVASFILEVIFHTKWWNYESQKFNIRGRICLKNTILFGVMSVVLIKLIHPFVTRLAGRIDPQILPFLCIFLASYFIIDTAITTVRILGLNNKLYQLGILITEFKENSEYSSWFKENDLWQSLSNLKHTNILKKKEERFNLLAHNIIGRRRLLIAFPNMTPKKSLEHFNELKKLLIKKRREFKTTKKTP